MRPGVRRTRRNLGLGIASLGATWAIGALVGWSSPTFALSMGTAYVGLAALAVTMLLGPWNVLRGRPNPVSTYLRRDWGLWAGLLAVVHVVVGLQRHFGGEWQRYFFFPDGAGALYGVRYDLFGLANWTGLIATLLIVILVVVSNDRALATLGSTRWKWLQRSSYIVFVAVAVHGVLFQMTIDRPTPWRVLLAVAVIVVVMGQVKGYRSTR
jgi:methionine sulfoxide reductase heme-binding subunit